MNSNHSELITILKNKTNFQILSQLKKSATLSSLVDKTQFNQLTIVKCIKTLHFHSLVEKNTETYHITKLGNLILQKFSALEFLSKYSNYFSSHTFGDIPDHLLVQINTFSDCELIESIWPTSTRFKEIVSGSTTFLNCIFTQPPFLLADSIFDKISNGIKLKLLFGQNSDIPDCNDLVEKLDLNKPKSSGIFEKRICETVTTNIIISDSGACLMLGDKSNVTDMLNTVVGNNKQFINWCNDFFNFKWKQGEMFARLRVKKL